MANTSYAFSKALSLTDYFDTFTNGINYATWDWKAFTQVKSTKRATEQAFGYYGMPIPRQWNELDTAHYADMGELDATTWTMVKYGVFSVFSFELLTFDQHIKDLLGKAGKDMGRKQGYLRDTLVANFFASIASTTCYDGSYYAATHTMKDGTSVDNDLTAASLSFDNLWSSWNYFYNSMYDHTGTRIIATPKWLITHPQNRKTVEKIFGSDREPDSGADNINNANTLKNKGIVPVYCPFLTSTTQYVMLAEEFADDFIMWEVVSPRFDTEDDFDLHGTKIRSWQMISTPKAKDFLNLVNNPGA
jgi:phage major head subunit gpT-like protein